jgi:hypothetical protein
VEDDVNYHANMLKSYLNAIEEDYSRGQQQLQQEITSEIIHQRNEKEGLKYVESERGNQDVLKPTIDPNHQK